MLALELKRMLRLKSTIIVAVLGLLCACGSPFLALIGTSIGQIDANGNIYMVSGPQAVSLRREMEKPYNGTVAPEKLWEITKQYQSLRAKYGESIPNNVYIEKVSPVESLLLLLSSAFAEPGAYGYDVLLSLSEEDVMNFYELRDNNVTEYLAAQLGENSPAYNIAAQKAAQVKVPFEFYSYNGWTTAAGNIGIIIIITSFAACIISAPVFSAEYQNGGHMILRAAKNGRKKLAQTKVAAAAIMSAIIYLAAISIYSCLCVLLFGSDGLKSPIQFSSFLSPMPFTYSDVFILSSAMGMVTVIAVSTFVAFLSSCFVSSAFAMAIGLGVIIVQQVIGSVSSMLTQFISDILPSSGSALYGELFRINYFTVGPIAVWSPYIIFLAGVISIPMFYLLAVHSYANHEAG